MGKQNIMLVTNVAQHVTAKAAIAAAAAVAAATTFVFSKMDADPALFFFDRQLRRRQRPWSTKSMSNSRQPPNHLIQNAFENKTILITGSTSGIGKELVYQLSQTGTVGNLILLGGRSTTTLEQLADECRHLRVEQHQQQQVISSGGKNDDGVVAANQSISKTKIWTIPLDMMAPMPASSLSSSSSSDAMNDFNLAIKKVEEILKEQNCNLDLVILNAGIGQLQPAKTTTSSTTEDIFRVNTLAPIAICQLLLERNLILTNNDDDDDGDDNKNNKKKESNLTQKQNRPSHIVVTSSIAALTGVPLSSSYAASKAALHSYFRSLQAEQNNLKVTLICPGSVDTNFFSSISSTRHDVSPTSNTTKEERVVGPEKTLKMAVSRCVELYISCLVMSMMMTSNDGNGGTNTRCRMREYWIAEQPTLFALYINRFFPTLFQWFLTNYVGPKRVQAWKDGKDLYDAQTWKSNIIPWKNRPRDDNP